MALAGLNQVEAKSVSVSACNLGCSGQHAFDMYALPPAAGTFLPCSRLRALRELVQGLAAAPAARVEGITADLLQVAFRGPRFFRKGSKTEDSALRPNLNQIMELMRGRDMVVRSEQGLCEMVKTVG